MSLWFCPSTALTYDFSLAAQIAQAFPCYSDCSKRQREHSMSLGLWAPSTVIRLMQSVLMAHVIECWWRILWFIRGYKTSCTENLLQRLPVRQPFGVPGLSGKFSLWSSDYACEIMCNMPLFCHLQYNRLTIESPMAVRVKKKWTWL